MKSIFDQIIETLYEVLVPNVTLQSRLAYLYLIQESEACSSNNTRFICPRQNEPAHFIYCCQQAALPGNLVIFSKPSTSHI